MKVKTSVGGRNVEIDLGKSWGKNKPETRLVSHREWTETLPPDHPSLFGTGPRLPKRFDKVEVFTFPGRKSGQVLTVKDADRGKLYTIKFRDGSVEKIHSHYVSRKAAGPKSGGAAWKRLMQEARTLERQANPMLDEEEIFDTIMLMAKNDGDAYRNNKNATQAVDEAIRTFRKDVGTEAREETAAIRARAIADLNAYWVSRNNNPCECMQLHNATDDAVVTLRLESPEETALMLISGEGRILDIAGESEYYAKWSPHLDTEIVVNVTPEEARRLLEAWKRHESRRGNPSFAMSESVRASIGAAAAATLGAFTSSNPWVIAVWAAVGSLIGSNWRKITAGAKAGTSAYRDTARANNPGPTNAQLIGKLKF